MLEVLFNYKRIQGLVVHNHSLHLAIRRACELVSLLLIVAPALPAGLVILSKVFAKHTRRTLADQFFGGVRFVGYGLQFSYLALEKRHSVDFEDSRHWHKGSFISVDRMSEAEFSHLGLITLHN